MRGRGDAEGRELRRQEIEGRAHEFDQGALSGTQIDRVQIFAYFVKNVLQTAGLGEDDVRLAVLRLPGLEAVGETGDGKQGIPDLVGDF